MSVLLSLSDVKAICFDIGDTLINVEQIMGQSVSQGVSKLIKDGVYINSNQFISAFFVVDKKYNALHANHLFSNHQIVKMTFESLGMSVALPVIGSFLTYYRDSVRNLLVYDRKLYNLIVSVKRAGHLVGVISDGTITEQLEVLSRLGIIHLFDQITISEDVGYEKPNHRIFERCFNGLRIKPNESLMIGDSYERDILGAINIGARTIWIRNSLNDLKDCAPDFEANSIYDLLSIIPSVNCE